MPQDAAAKDTLRCGTCVKLAAMPKDPDIPAALAAPNILHDAALAQPLPTHPKTMQDPLHGVTLAMVVESLRARHGWAAMAARVPVRCFQFDPSVKSSLIFLRRTPWAREKIEAWYVADQALAPPVNPWAAWSPKPTP